MGRVQSDTDKATRRSKRGRVTRVTRPGVANDDAIASVTLLDPAWEREFGSFGHPALKFPAWECLGYLKHPTRHTHFLGGGWGKNPGTLARARRWTSALELFNECAPWVANGFDAMWFGIGKPYMVCLFVCLICSSCMYRCLSQEDGGSSFNHVYTPLIRLAVFFSGRWGS